LKRLALAAMKKTTSRSRTKCSLPT